MELQTSTKNNFYFQLLLKQLSWAGEEPIAECYFTVSRGRQIFEFTKPTSPLWNTSRVASLHLKLNFVVINYSSQKDQEFSVKIVSPVSDQAHGIDTLDCNAFIDHFLKTGQTAFAVALALGPHHLQSQIYLGRSRVAVQKAAREAQKGELASIQQRPKEKRGRGDGGSNRYRRTPSPTRRQIQDIITRRKSPNRTAPRPEFKFPHNNSQAEEKAEEAVPEKTVLIAEESVKLKKVEHTGEKKEEVKEENKQTEEKQEAKLSTQKTGAVQVENPASPTHEETPQTKTGENQKLKSSTEGQFSGDSSQTKMLGNPKVLVPLVIILLMLIMGMFSWSSTVPKKKKLKQPVPQPKAVPKESSPKARQTPKGKKK